MLSTAGTAAGSRRRDQESAKSSTPTVTAESATLKTGQCHCGIPTSMKSTTSPLVTRSTRLPTAPLRMSVSAVPRTGSCPARPRRNIHTIATMATSEKM